MTWPNDIESLPTDFTGADSAATRDHAGLHTTSFRLLNSLQSELGTNPRGAAASVRARLDALDATDALKTDAATVGNLLTANQASIETDLTGLGVWNACTIAPTSASAAHGTYSVEMTATGTGTMTAGTVNSAAYRVPVKAGETITVSATVYRPSGYGTRKPLLQVAWYDSGGTVQSYGNDPAFYRTIADDTQTLFQFSTVVPANISWASVVVTGESGAIGNKLRFDKLGIWKGGAPCPTASPRLSLPTPSA